MNPKVTVLMSVFNGEEFLKEAIESIVNQIFIDFEFLIIDDGSTDDSVKIIEEINDPRIKIVRNEKNLGLAASLNIGIKLAKGEYIARMDADDISMPERLEKQVKFMEGNPEVGVLGTWYEKFPEHNVIKTKPVHEEIYANLFIGNSFGHSTVILRKSVLEKNQLFYNENFKSAQDYELWTRLISLTKTANLEEILVKQRVHKNQISQTMFEDQINNDIKIKVWLYSKLIQIQDVAQFTIGLVKLKKNGGFLSNQEYGVLSRNFLKTLRKIEKNNYINKKIFFNSHYLLAKKAFFQIENISLKTFLFFLFSDFFWKCSKKEKVQYLQKFISNYFLKRK